MPEEAICVFDRPFLPRCVGAGVENFRPDLFFEARLAGKFETVVRGDAFHAVEDASLLHPFERQDDAILIQKAQLFGGDAAAHAICHREKPSGSADARDDGVHFQMPGFRALVGRFRPFGEEGLAHAVLRDVRFGVFFASGLWFIGGLAAHHSDVAMVDVVVETAQTRKFPALESFVAPHDGEGGIGRKMSLRVQNQFGETCCDEVCHFHSGALVGVARVDSRLRQARVVPAVEPSAGMLQTPDRLALRPQGELSRPCGLWNRHGFGETPDRQMRVVPFYESVPFSLPEQARTQKYFVDPDAFSRYTVIYSFRSCLSFFDQQYSTRKAGLFHSFFTVSVA